MADYAPVLEVVVVVPLHYFMYSMELPRALEQLQWDQSRLSVPARIGELGKDNWRLFRVAVSYCLIDRHLGQLSRLAEQLRRYSWLLIAASSIALITGFATKGAGGVIAEHAEGLMQSGEIGVVIPFVLSVLIRGSVYKLERLLRLGKRNPDALLRI